MRRTKTLWMMTAAVTALTGLTACSSDDEQQAANSQKEIRLASSVGDGEDYATRSNTATNLQSGDTCYVWADMVNATTGVQSEYFKAWALKANGAGGLTTLATGNAKLFPATNALNFYAIVGNFGRDTNNDPMVTPEETPLPASGIIHTVLDNQSIPANYYKSDLLYAVKKNQEPISEAVVLPFKHLLSRIQVVLVAGNGMQTTDLNEATVEMLDVKRQVTFSPDSTKDFATATASMISIPLTSQHSNILLATNAVGKIADITATSYADAIIVPQTFAAGTQLFKVTYLGRETYYTVPTGGIQFESGKQYRYQLICDRIGATYVVTPTIAPWLSQDRINVWVEYAQN